MSYPKSFQVTVKAIGICRYPFPGTRALNRRIPVPGTYMLENGNLGRPGRIELN